MSVQWTYCRGKKNMLQQIITHTFSLLAEGTTSNPTGPIPLSSLSGSDLIWLLAFLIPLFPYLAFAIILFVGFKKQNDNLNHNISILANIGSFAVAVFLFLIQLANFVFFTPGHMESVDISLYNWAPPFMSVHWTVDIGILIDPLSTIMFTLVSLLALLIQIYGKAYMHGEKGVASGRYNAEISLFVGSMLLLTLASNQLVFFIGWELMGLCSYLLIGFFLDKDSKPRDDIKNAPASAAKKAFIVTKIGDVLLMAGIALLFWFMIKTGNPNPLDYLSMSNSLATGQLKSAGFDINMQNLVAILLFSGAVGKSAQFPLHVWLPDAMEGPTTVSALIHSATMVKAGVFLVARNYFLFQGTDALMIVGAVGGFTAIFAATMAFVADDVKRVLAYSTISQLGYMFLGLGAGSLSGGMFHLISHSFFKCLLFLDAGSLIHAVHSNDMWDMGGLKDKMPWTFRTMVVGGLGLSGFVFFNGFYSKDGVISAAGIQYANTGNIIYGFMFVAGLLTALLTAFYTFRMIYTVFYGKPRYDETHVHPHESPSLMRYPLIVIASIVFGTGILSTEGFISNITQAFFGINFNFLGNLNIFNEYTIENLFSYWYLPGTFDSVNPTIATGSTFLGISSFLFFKVLLSLIALIFVVIGIYLAYLMYHPKGQLQNFPDSLNNSVVGKPVATLLIQKYYLDTLYIGIAHFIRDGFAEFVRMIDSGIDFLVDGTGRVTKEACGYAVAIDDNVIDGAVRKLSNGTFTVGKWLRRRQTGVLENYTQQLILGLIVVMIIILGYFYILPTYF